MSGPTLSALMPNYNHAEYLPRAIEEIVHQTRPPDEFIVLDDASTDDSVRIIESYLEQYPFMRLVRNERNLGVIRSHRRLFEMAGGDYVYAGAADDGRFPAAFELGMEMAGRHPEAGLVFGKALVVDEQDRQRPQRESRAGSAARCVGCSPLAGAAVCLCGAIPQGLLGG